MKKMLSITAIAGLLVSMSFANWTEGTKSVAGSFSYESSTTNSVTSTSWTFNPSVGYFLMDNVAVNFGANMKNDGTDTATSWNVGGSYYMNEWYGTAAYGTGAEDNTNYMRFGGGYMYGLSDGIYLDTGVRYNMGMGDNKTNTMNFVVGVSTYF